MEGGAPSGVDLDTANSTERAAPDGGSVEIARGVHDYTPTGTAPIAPSEEVQHREVAGSIDLEHRPEDAESSGAGPRAVKVARRAPHHASIPVSPISAPQPVHHPHTT